MKMFVFSVLDKAVGAYLRPFYTRSKSEAIRSFSDACSDEKSEFAKHSADFVLCAHGMYDDCSGLYECGEPVHVITALECVVDNVFPPSKEVNGKGEFLRS